MPKRFGMPALIRRYRAVLLPRGEGHALGFSLIWTTVISTVPGVRQRPLFAIKGGGSAIHRVSSVENPNRPERFRNCDGSIARVHARGFRLAPPDGSRWLQ